jgi:hypothetical protein
MDATNLEIDLDLTPNLRHLDLDLGLYTILEFGLDL